jgi:glycosyltransferase involved in cell wall biosynthesis
VQAKTIAFLLPRLSGGGAERVALTLVTALAERGHELDLVVMEKSGELVDLVPPGVRLIDLKAPRVRNVVRPLVRYLRERRPDVMQVSMWPLTVMAVIAKRLSRIPVRCVVSDHSVFSHHYPKSRHLTIGATMRLFYPWADARVTVSSGAADDLATLSGLRRSTFDVIPNPVDFPAVLAKRADGDALWGGGSKRILTVGHLKRDKNHALLIRAFAKLPRDLDAELMIAGNGSLRADLIALAEQEGVADRVILPGFMPDPWPLYASADLFALSSRQESFGNVLVEALYAGLPIVSTENIGASEVLDNGQWGRMVAQDDIAGFAKAMEDTLRAPRRNGLVRARALALSGTGSLDRYEALLLSGSAPPVQAAVDRGHAGSLG